MLSATLLGRADKVAYINSLYSDDSWAGGKTCFAETDQVQEGVYGPIFGVGSTRCSENMYWNWILNGQSSKSCEDPYGLIDGGIPGTAYQICCTTGPWTPEVLAIKLIPELYNNWGYYPFVEYIERIHSYGTWGHNPSQGRPDTCKMLTQSDFPDNLGCKSGGSRWDGDKDGKKIYDNAGYKSIFATEMWDEYHS